MVRKALEVQIGLAEQALHELQESGRKAMARFSVLERQGEKLSTEKNEIVKQRINLYEQYADGEMSKAGEVFVCENAAYHPYSEDEAAKVLKEDEIDILVDLGSGSATAKAWGCDLTYDYVKINGDYRT